MGWRFDNPLYTLNTDDTAEKAKKLWEGESLGGLTEDNNRLPVPVVGLLALTIITAFLVTAPLWGSRPKAGIYEDMVTMLEQQEVVAAADDAKRMDIIMAKLGPDHKHMRQITQHPVEVDDLRNLAPIIKELKAKNQDLAEYNVVGSKIVMANFEGNFIVDKNTGEVRRERKQPWWDKGYLIDVFYVIYFCLAVMVVVKRLPPYTWQPDHSKSHGKAHAKKPEAPMGGAKAVGNS